jgi:hypothetical protein
MDAFILPPSGEVMPLPNAFQHLHFESEGMLDDYVRPAHK